ncbi:MAG: hypothetical protein B7Y76_04360, partial [Sphingobacteriia bacterium 35-40-5]
GIEREAKSITYATQGVSAKELTVTRSLNVVNSLQGKVDNETKSFLDGIHEQYGKIKKREFYKYVMGSFASYKTQFEKKVMALNIAIDNQSLISGFQIIDFVNDLPIAPERNTSKLQFPAKGEWTVIWGGDTKSQNYHVESRAQKNAFDIVMKGPNGKSYKTNGKTNEDYYAFGVELYAPCDATVAVVVDGIQDNIPGELNPMYVPGNTVILKTANGEFLFFAHFKYHTIKVKTGDKISRGQLLGQCGNSGSSSEAHIHFHIQNTDNMMNATGIKCYFDDIKINGQLKKDYSPVQKDLIQQEP